LALGLPGFLTATFLRSFLFIIQTLPNLTAGSRPASISARTLRPVIPSIFPA
jgi:hypothetical protein